MALLSFLVVFKGIQVFLSSSHCEISTDDLSLHQRKMVSCYYQSRNFFICRSDSFNLIRLLLLFIVFSLITTITLTLLTTNVVTASTIEIDIEIDLESNDSNDLSTIISSSKFLSSNPITVEASPPVNGSCAPFSTSQLSILQDLYESTNGDQWVYPLFAIPWNFNVPYPDPCAVGATWYGISCSGLCQISGINLISNNLHGVLPDSLGQFGPQFTVLTINQNRGLFGTIPESIGNLTSLLSLTLSTNNLYGTFPESLFNCHSLISLNINDNDLTGTLPQTGWINAFPILSTLIINYNEFSGPVPVEWFQMYSLGQLNAPLNAFTGTFPSLISPSSQLYQLDLSMNRLNGTLPYSVGNLKKMKKLILFSNFFTGSLPSSIDKMTSLTSLELDGNAFTGSLPSSLLNLKKLQYFYLFNNHFTGQLPAFGSTNRIQNFNIFNNYFSHTLPANITLSGGMRSFDIHANLFTGTLPSVLMEKNSMMVYLYVHNNAFTGTIASLSKFTSLQQSRFDWNLFTGGLPSGIGEAPRLESTNVSYNILSGTFNGTDLGESQTLSTLDLGQNYFSGTIGDIFSKPIALHRLILQGNFLTGPIDKMLNFSIQRNLSTVDISANDFSGTIPQSFYTQSNLSIFLASTNCLSASISDSICANNRWKMLILDGLHSAEFCRKLIFPDLHKTFDALGSYVLTTPIQGSVPACLFTLPQLTTLHISGNDLHGTIPNVDELTPTLKDLSLSHNQLTGTIPPTLLSYPWKKLDLSFNRLFGTLPSSVNNFTQGTLKLDINRISGSMPSVLVNAPSITVLQGNIFECPEGKKQLPQNDESLDSYDCGSDSVNDSLYTVIGGYFMLVLVIAVTIVTVKDVKFREWNGLNRFLYRCFRYVEVEVFLWWQIYNSKSSSLYFNQPIEHVYEFGAVMKEVRRWCIAIGAVMVFVLLPLYPLLSLKYETYWYSYAWGLSVAYMSGLVPAVVVMIVMILFLCAIYSGSPLWRRQWTNVYNLYHRSGTKMITATPSVNEFERENETQSERDSEKDNEDVRASTHSTVSTVSTMSATTPATIGVGSMKCTLARTYTGWYLAMIIGGLINIAVVLIVNVGYILAVTGGQVSSDVQQVLSIVISLFNGQWNGTIMEAFQGLLMRIMPLDRVRDKTGEVAVVSFMVWMNLFNDILAACIAVLFVSPDCFYYAFFPAPLVSTSFGFTECDGQVYSSTGGGAFCEAQYKTAYHSKYAPAFNYNYQCSSSLLTNFADVIVYRYIMSGLVNPVVAIVFKYLQEEAFARYGQGSKLYMIAVSMVPETWLPLSDSAYERRRASLGLQSGQTGIVSEKDGEKDKKDEDDSKEEKEEGVFEAQFKAKNSIISFISDIAVMLTFGGIFPPLAFIGVFSLCINTLMTQMALGRVVVLSRTQIKLRKSVERINEKCAGVRMLLIRSLVSLSLLLSLFWSFFLFDILGNQVGAIKAIWIIAVMAATPGTIQLITWLTNSTSSAMLLEDEEDAKRKKKLEETERLRGIHARWTESSSQDIELAQIKPATVTNALHSSTIIQNK